MGDGAPEFTLRLGLNAELCVRALWKAQLLSLKIQAQPKLLGE